MKAPPKTAERKTTLRRKMELPGQLDGTPLGGAEDLLVYATRDLARRHNQPKNQERSIRESIKTYTCHHVFKSRVFDHRIEIYSDVQRKAWVSCGRKSAFGLRQGGGTNSLNRQPTQIFNCISQIHFYVANRGANFHNA